MARPKSDEKRAALLSAAIRVIAAQGLAAPTATIAKEAGVANGSLFNYFATKGELFNELFIELKTQMAVASMTGVSGHVKLRDKLLHGWCNWLSWTSSNQEQRRVLALLGTCDELTPATRALGHQTMAPIAELLQLCRVKGPLRDAPIGFVAALMNSMAEATVDFILQDPSNAAQHSKVGFDALWRVVG